MLIIRKSHLQLPLVGVVSYFFSHWLISNYLYGDQVYYRALYEALSSTSFLDVLSVAEQYIKASDALSFYLLWVGAIFEIDKDIYIALANTVLLLLLYVLARRHGINYSMIALLMCNFYVIVLMTGAERLKFSFIFLMLAALARGRKSKIILFLLSIFAHLQTLIFLASLALNHYKIIILDLFRGVFRKNGVVSLVGVMTLGGALFYGQSNAIEEKFRSYAQAGALTETLQIFLFLLAGLFFVKNKFGFFVSLLALMMLTLFIGGNRVNMIAVFVGVYLFWIEDKGNHPFLYATMIYFALKSIPFVLNIMNHGNGFYAD